MAFLLSCYFPQNPVTQRCSYKMLSMAVLLYVGKWHYSDVIRM